MRDIGRELLAHIGVFHNGLMLAADGVHQGHKLRVRGGCLLLARAVHIMGKALDGRHKAA